ncbi:MAG: type I glyceraldehyde-3-phosphate dehydrogenase [Deltaproteobacteria bacterium]|nr:type I glyceraldehyde-3-phosphate dehydrogenase [Deltaproteobacteria bacterium]
MATRIAINGFGRIGRCVTRVLESAKNADIQLVAINDLTDPATLAHLLAFDSVHRTFATPVEAASDGIVVGGRKIPIFAKKDPAELPWKDLGVDIVMECTGVFRDKAGGEKHIAAGAKRVIISAPGEKDIDGTFCVGINTDGYDAAKHRIISNASCTTNCLAPMAKVLHDTFGLLKGHMVTVHSYTNDQNLLDLPHKDLRRARAAALSIIPTTTGAATAVGEVLPELKGRLDGISMRVPTPNVSVVDLAVIVDRKTSKEEVNAAFKAAADGPLKGILEYSTAELVSIDFRGNPHSSIVDVPYTSVMDGDFVKVLAWYDNEWAYSSRCVDLLRFIVKKGL